MKVLLIVLVLFLNGASTGHVVVAPTMHDCEAAKPAITQEYRDAQQIPGWSVQDVKSVCIAFE